eukprot:scaffold20225_cov121-Isochrysis_galbana.AAC.6
MRIRRASPQVSSDTGRGARSPAGRKSLIPRRRCRCATQARRRRRAGRRPHPIAHMVRLRRARRCCCPRGGGADEAEEARGVRLWICHRDARPVTNVPYRLVPVLQPLAQPVLLQNVDDAAKEDYLLSRLEPARQAVVDAHRRHRLAPAIARARLRAFIGLRQLGGGDARQPHLGRNLALALRVVAPGRLGRRFSTDAGRTHPLERVAHHQPRRQAARAPGPAKA